MVVSALTDLDQLPNSFAWQGMLLLVSRWQELCVSWPPTGFKLKRERERERESESLVREAREVSNQSIGKPPPCRIMAETLAWKSLDWRSMLSWLNAARSRHSDMFQISHVNPCQICDIHWYTMWIYVICQSYCQSYNVLRCLTARSWSPISNLLGALRPCWYNGLEWIGKTVRLSQKSFELWYFKRKLNLRLWNHFHSTCTFWQHSEHRCQCTESRIRRDMVTTQCSFSAKTVDK